MVQKVFSFSNSEERTGGRTNGLNNGRTDGTDGKKGRRRDARTDGSNMEAGILYDVQARALRNLGEIISKIRNKCSVLIFN